MTTMQREAKTLIREFNPVDGKFFLVEKPDGSLFAKAYTRKDAELCASKLELLEALKTIVSDINNGSLGNALSVARFAISKAEGREV